MTGRRQSRTKTPTNFIKATKTIHCRTPQKNSALRTRVAAAHAREIQQQRATTPAIAIRTRARATTKRERRGERTEEGPEEEAVSTNTHKQGRRPIAGYKQFPKIKRQNARARKRRREAEETKAAGDRTHDHTWPTERPRDTKGMGQTYLADRPRRPARARSEIAGSDRAVVSGPPFRALALVLGSPPSPPPPPQCGAVVWNCR